MPRKSTKENKNVYFQAREEAGLTRAQAAEKMMFSESSLEKIENDKQRANPYDITRMAEAYKKPELCNYYCVNECEIGKTTVPAVEVKELSQIVLSLLANLNTLEHDKESLIAITSDGVISDDELEEFTRISSNLEKMSITVETMKLWVKHTIATGEINSKKMEEIRQNLNKK